ncbi:MAG: transposase [Deltaproteobacteria bacterium]|nr:transposase [Deltaproteobacteria bacterium]
MSKHLKDARKFVHSLGKRRLKSDISQQYGRRFTKYEEKLFEFMNHDGIPWNNNNAENAIKPFAKYRRLVKGRITEPGVKDYLVLLSMYQTCKYRNISFFDFLLSKEQDIDKYCGKGKSLLMV